MEDRARRQSTLPPTSGAQERSDFQLRARGAEMPLEEGRFVIGRASHCDFRLEGSLVSRQHAAIVVRRGTVILEDLGSRNGVLVNGAVVRGSIALQEGDRIQIGDDELRLVRRSRPRVHSEPQRPASARVQSEPVAVDDEEHTKRVDPLELMSTIVDRALVSGNADEAESLVAGHLSVLLREAREHGALKPTTSRAAATYALKLAATTGKSAWVDYVFDLYLTSKAVIPLGIVHELFNVSSRARASDKRLLRRYMEFLRTNGSELGLEASVVLQRLERFERL